MEHLFQNLEQQSLPIKVPVLDLCRYDGHDFQTFPERHGYTPDDHLREAVFVKRAAQDLEQENQPSLSSPPQVRKYALSLVQEWLFFGLLVTFGKIFQITVRREDFIRVEEGIEYHCTAKLVEIARQVLESYLGADLRLQYSRRTLLERFKTRWKKILEPRGSKRDTADDAAETEKTIQWTSLDFARYSDPARKEGKQLNFLIETATKFLRGAVYNDSYEVDDTSLPIWLSCYILAESLDNLSTWLLADSPMSTAACRSGDHLVQRLTKAKDCQRFQRLDEELGFSTDRLLTITALGGAIDNHSTCDEHRCSLITDINRLPSHQNTCSGQCANVCLGTESRSLGRTILNGNDFVLCKMSIENDRPIVDLVPRKTCSSYIAISHVW